jgi:hypothetical protein
VRRYSNGDKSDAVRVTGKGSEVKQAANQLQILESTANIAVSE